MNGPARSASQIECVTTMIAPARRPSTHAEALASVRSSPQSPRKVASISSRASARSEAATPGGQPTR